jgi:hypothetical protein
MQLLGVTGSSSRQFRYWSAAPDSVVGVSLTAMMALLGVSVEAPN